MRSHGNTYIDTECLLRLSRQVVTNKNHGCSIVCRKNCVIAVLLGDWVHFTLFNVLILLMKIKLIKLNLFLVIITN